MYAIPHYISTLRLFNVDQDGVLKRRNPRYGLQRLVLSLFTSSSQGYLPAKQKLLLATLTLDSWRVATQHMSVCIVGELPSEHILSFLRVHRDDRHLDLYTYARSRTDIYHRRNLTSTHMYPEHDAGCKTSLLYIRYNCRYMVYMKSSALLPKSSSASSYTLVSSLKRYARSKIIQKS